jgi:hypothetical protein
LLILIEALIVFFLLDYKLFFSRDPVNNYYVRF